MNKLLLRSISGLVYVGLIVGSLLLGNKWFGVVTLIMALLASIEFQKISHGGKVLSKKLCCIDIIGISCLLLSMLWTDFIILGCLCWLTLLIVRVISELYSKNNNPLKSLAISFMNQIYIVLPLALMLILTLIPGGTELVLLIFIYIWINDTGAYLVGCTFGRHRLFERISPKKSWEGFFGGLFFNILASVIFLQCGVIESINKINFDDVIWMGLPVVVTVFATWGDLVESLIKRTLQIKDSGNIIPGHGGILDRIDSLLLVIPAVWLYIFVIVFFDPMY